MEFNVKILVSWHATNMRDFSKVPIHSEREFHIVITI